MLVKIEKKKVADYWHNVREQFKGKYDVETKAIKDLMRGKDLIVPFANIQIDVNGGEDVFSFWNFALPKDDPGFENGRYYFEAWTTIEKRLFVYSFIIYNDYHVIASTPYNSVYEVYIEESKRSDLMLVNAVKYLNDENTTSEAKHFLNTMITYSIECLLYVLCIFSESQSKDRIYKYIGEPSVKRGIKKRGYSQIVLHENIQAKIYKEDVELIERIREKKYERHAEAWEVRGHLRRYRSGKVVYIKPYTKGHGRVNRKEYAIK